MFSTWSEYYLLKPTNVFPTNYSPGDVRGPQISKTLQATKKPQVSDYLKQVRCWGRTNIRHCHSETWFVYPWVMSQFWVFCTPNKWQVSFYYHHHNHHQQQHRTLFNSLPQSSSCGWSLQVSFRHPGFIHPRGLYSKANFDILFFIQYKCCVKFCVVINFTDNIWNIFLLMSAFSRSECSQSHNIGQNHN